LRAAVGLSLTAALYCLVSSRAAGLSRAGPEGLAADRSNTTTEQQADATSGLASAMASPKEVYSKAETIRLVWVLTNAAANDVLVVSHYAAGERKHFDNLELRIVRRADRHAWSLSFSGPRKGAAKIGCVLRAGHSLRHEIDLSYWSRLHGVDLGVGTFDIVGTYRVPPGEPRLSDWASCDAVPLSGTGEAPLEHGTARDPWRGVLVTRPLVVRIADD
jgi:hypothetical protein